MQYVSQTMAVFEGIHMYTNGNTCFFFGLKFKQKRKLWLIGFKSFPFYNKHQNCSTINIMGSFLTGW